MSDAVALHQKLEHVISGSPRGQLPVPYSYLIHSLESAIRKVDENDNVWAISVYLNDGFQERYYCVRAECIGAKIVYEIKSGFGAMVKGEMRRAEIRRWR